MSWRLLSFNDWSAIEDARTQTHQAVQLVSSVSRGLLPNDPGDGYANLEWTARHRMLMSQPFSDKKCQAGLQPSNLVYHFLKADISIAEFDLKGKTMKQGLAWIKEQVNLLGKDASLINSDLPYEIPVYPQAKGQPFHLSNNQAFQELSVYFSNADFMLKRLQAKNPAASEVRCWPHHFDLATLITLEKHEDPEQARTIGVGLSPGDGNYEEPYFYITPWPYPEIKEKALPKLPEGGEWHVKGWTGAILQGSELVKDQSPKSQELKLANFLEAGINQIREWLIDS